MIRIIYRWMEADRWLRQNSHYDRYNDDQTFRILLVHDHRDLRLAHVFQRMFRHLCIFVFAVVSM